MKSETMQNQKFCRCATTDDISSIHQITHEAFTQHAQMSGNYQIAALSETEEDIKSDLGKKNVFIAEINEVPLGVARCEIFSDEQNKKIAYLSRFAVKTDAQNKGIGTMLINQIIDFAKKNDCCAVCLHTSSKMSLLARFYYKNHFFIHSVTTDRGYYRALFVHEFDTANTIYDYAKVLVSV